MDLLRQYLVKIEVVFDLVFASDSEDRIGAYKHALEGELFSPTFQNRSFSFGPAVAREDRIETEVSATLEIPVMASSEREARLRASSEVPALLALPEGSEFSVSGVQIRSAAVDRKDKYRLRVRFAGDLTLEAWLFGAHERHEKLELLRANLEATLRRWGEPSDITVDLLELDHQEGRYEA